MKGFLTCRTAAMKLSTLASNQNMPIGPFGAKNPDLPFSLPQTSLSFWRATDILQYHRLSPLRLSIQLDEETVKKCKAFQTASRLATALHEQVSAD